MKMFGQILKILNICMFYQKHLIKFKNQIIKYYWIKIIKNWKTV